MGYNYGMQGKTSQQQAIVRQREREEELRKKEAAKQNEISCKAIQQAGDYKVVSFSKGIHPVLELRVTGSAIANQPCGIERVEIHQWLETTGMQYAKQTKSFEIVLITSKDVVDGKLITEWKNLNKVNE